MTVLTLIRFEWRHRRLLWIGALFSMLSAQIVPTLVGRHDHPMADQRTAMALLIGLCFAAVTGLVLGATTINRDLREGRLGFFLALPVDPLELLAGKLIGAWLLCAGLGLLVMAPALPRMGMNEWISLLWILGPPLLGLILLVHLVFFVLSARTAWLLLDLASLSVLAGSILLWVRGVQATTAISVTRVPVLLFAALCPLLTVLAALQMRAGRTSLTAGHRALSLAFALGTLLLAGVGFLHLRLARRVAWADLRGARRTVPAPKGAWRVVLHEGGWALLEAEGGSGLALGVLPGSSPVFAGNGERVAWLAPLGLSGCEVWTAALGQGVRETRGTGLRTRWEPQAQLALSPSGGRLALLGSQHLTIMDVASGRELFHATVTEALLHAPKLWFTDEDHLRVETPEPIGHLGLQEVDLARGRMERTGNLRVPEGGGAP